MKAWPAGAAPIPACTPPLSAMTHPTEAFPGDEIRSLTGVPPVPSLIHYHGWTAGGPEVAPHPVALAEARARARRAAEHRAWVLSTWGIPTRRP